MLLRDVEVNDCRTDVRVDGGVIAEMGRLQRQSGEEVVAGRGGALIAGLHDHHIHLHALAADRISIDCSHDLEGLRYGRVGADGWVRGVRARESVTREVLDQLVPDRPARVQHRSGALWMLNSAALAAVDLDDSGDVERDPLGRPTGRLWRYDSRLRDSLPSAPIALAPLVDELMAYGVTSVTDATPDLEPNAVKDLRRLDIPVSLLGDPDGDAPWKLLLRDHDLPTYDQLRRAVSTRRPRPVAVHCVTRESLLLTLAVLEDVGRVAGDRIEHAAVVPEPRALTGLTVVTQPAFVTTRGDDYRCDVDPLDLPHLYRYQSLLNEGVDVLPSSDAPYGPADPWAVMRAARDRDLGPAERVNAATVLSGYQADASVRPGAPARLVLLHTGLAEALDALDAQVVRATWSARRRPPGG